MTEEVKLKEPEQDMELPAFIRKKIANANVRVNVSDEDGHKQKDGSVISELTAMERDIDTLEKLLYSFESILKPVLNDSDGLEFDRDELLEPATEVAMRVRKLRERIFTLQDMAKRTAERIDL